MKKILSVSVLLFSLSFYSIIEAEENLSATDTIILYKVLNYDKNPSKQDIEYAYEIGDAYLNSKNVEMDIQKAFKYFTYAAHYHHGKSQFEIGRMYEFWYMWNPVENLSYIEKLSNFFSNWNQQWYLQTSFDWYEKSARSGYAEAYTELGLSYYYGRGVPINIKNAYYWFTLGAKENELISIDFMKSIGQDLTAFQIKEINSQVKK